MHASSYTHASKPFSLMGGIRSFKPGTSCDVCDLLLRTLNGLVNFLNQFCSRNLTTFHVLICVNWSLLQVLIAWNQKEHFHTSLVDIACIYCPKQLQHVQAIFLKEVFSQYVPLLRKWIAQLGKVLPYKPP